MESVWDQLYNAAKAVLHGLIQPTASLNIGNSSFPFTYCGTSNVHRNRKLFLRDIFCGTQTLNVCTDSHFHNNTSIE